MYIGFHMKYPLFLSYFNGTRTFADIFLKIIQISNFMKIHSVEAELFDADGRQEDRQTDTTKLMVAVRNFANAPKNRLNYTDFYYAFVSNICLVTAFIV